VSVRTGRRCRGYMRVADEHDPDETVCMRSGKEPGPRLHRTVPKSETNLAHLRSAFGTAGVLH
jgi:hypothetical protein